MHDLALDALHASLRGLSARQRTVADNIANVETPTFMSGRVDFEDSLRAAIYDGEPGSAMVTSRRSMGPTMPNGNNVQLDEETLAMVETGLRFDLSIQAMNAKYRLLRTVINTQA